MLQPGLEEVRDVVVVETVVRHAALAPVGDDAELAELAQVMAHRRLARADHRGQVADTQVAVHQRLDDAQAGGVGEHLEEVREPGHLVVLRAAPQRGVDRVLVDELHVAERVGWGHGRRVDM